MSSNLVRTLAYSRVGLFASITALTGIAIAGSAFPDGTYASGPYMLDLKRDGTFRVIKSGYALVEGEYSVTDDRIQLTDKSGPFACAAPGQATGTYNWKVQNGMLTLNKIEDKCVDRSQSFVGASWKRQ